MARVCLQPQIAPVDMELLLPKITIRIGKEPLEPRLTDSLEPEELQIIKFVHSWYRGQTRFSFPTSGTSGKSKQISLSRRALEYSATTTLKYLGIKQGGSSLLCIPPLYIGGTMVIVRALVGAMSLRYCPGKELQKLQGNFTLTSMVPRQLRELLQSRPETLRLFKCILVGGAPLDGSVDRELEKARLGGVRIYHTFAMTETASHFALRSPGTLQYTTLGDASIKVAADGRLMVHGTITENKWIKTQDQATLISPGKFVWEGRKGMVLGSGGKKVSIDSIEKLMGERSGRECIVIGGTDKDGQKRIDLIIKGGKALSPQDFSDLPIHLRPGKCYVLEEFVYTASGKIDRRATSEKAEEVESL